MSSSSPPVSMSRSDWLSAVIVIVIWGVNFVVMKWGLLTLSPMLLCVLRFLAASLPFLLFVKPPKGISWWLIGLYGLVLGIGQFGVLFTAMRLGMPAGMASVVLQTQAFLTMLLAAVMLGELIGQGKSNLQAPWLGLTAFFALALILSLLVFIGEACRDAYDPRT